MKTVLSMLLTAVLLFTMATLAAADGKTNRSQNVVPQACAPVLSAPSFIVEGTVTAVSSPDARNGITVLANDAAIAFYGLGPARYWDTLGIDRPEVGDFVTIEAKAVTVNEAVMNIIVSLAYEDGTSIQLRDQATGCALWREFSRAPRNGSN